MLETLYIAGALLEAAGILTVVLENFSNARRAKRLAELERPSFTRAAVNVDRLARSPASRRGPHAGHPQEGQVIARALLEADKAVTVTWAQMMQMFEEVFTGGRRLATIGVALLILGLVVSTTGNILSL